MDVNVYVESVLTPQSFVSKRDNSTMTRYSFIGLIRSGQYQKKVCFSCLGDDRWKNLGIVVGCEYNISFDMESREFNGRWYTDVIPWKAVALNGQQQVPVQQAQQPQVQYQPAPQQGYVPQQPMVQQQGYAAQPQQPMVQQPAPQPQAQQVVPQQNDGLPF